MTVEASTTFTAPKRRTSLAVPLDGGGKVTARMNADEVRIETPNRVFWVDYTHLEPAIEILFAVKAEIEAKAAFERRWLAEQAEVDVHTIEGDIIAVDEPTA